jgi:N-methylhydantoinase B
MTIILAAIERIFDETEAKCRNVSSRRCRRHYEASKRPRRRRRAARRAGADPRQGHDRGSDMTIDLSGCSSERKAAINSRTLAGARVAYKALTGPLDPVNEGSFRALEGDHPRRQHHDGALSRADVGLEPASCRPSSTRSSKRWPGDARHDAGRAPRACSAARSSSSASIRKTKRRFVVQSIEGGGWGGRPWEDGESGTVSVCQGDVRNGRSRASS